LSVIHVVHGELLSQNTLYYFHTILFSSQYFSTVIDE